MRKICRHICLIFCVLFLTQTIFAQVEVKNEKQNKKSEPILFDTYVETSNNSESLLKAYADRFAKALKESPETTKGVIIVYSGSHENMCSKDKRFVEKEFKFLQSTLIKSHKISTDRVSSIFSLWRECNEVAIWLVPKDAKMPIASPTLIMDYRCETVSVNGAEQVNSKTQFIYFKVPDSYWNEFEYKWTVSVGKIVEGQGTHKIKVDISNFATQEVKAIVEAQDIILDLCQSKDSFTTQVIP